MRTPRCRYLPPPWPRRAASPLHLHTREAEAFYLLAGTMTYRAGSRLAHLAAGDFIYLPRGVPHAFRITGDVTARFLALTVPGGLLDLYAEAGRAAPCSRPARKWTWPRRRPAGTGSPRVTA